MRKPSPRVAVVTAALCAAALFTGCSERTSEPAVNRAAERFSKVREVLLAAPRVTVTAAVSADYGERVFEFRLQYSGTQEGGELELLSPQMLAGVTARVSNNAATIRYDGAELDTGSLGDGLSPAGIVPRLIVEWQSGFADSLVIESGALIMQSALTADARQVTHFDNATGSPVRTEVICSGRVVLTVLYESFAIDP